MYVYIYFFLVKIFEIFNCSSENWVFDLVRFFICIVILVRNDGLFIFIIFFYYYFSFLVRSILICFLLCIFLVLVFWLLYICLGN